MVRINIAKWGWLAVIIAFLFGIAILPCLADSVYGQELESLAAAAGVKLPVITTEMVKYSFTRYLIHFAGFAYEIIVLLLILGTGLSSFIRNVAQKIRQPFLSLLAYFAMFSFCFGLMNLPFLYYSSYFLDHSYKLSNQPLADWFLDLCKAIGIEIALAAPCWFAFFYLVKKYPQKWALMFLGLMIPLTMLMFYAEPLLIEPMFNKIEHMPASALKGKIDNLAGKAGIPDAEIFIVDKSKQTNKVNAYVTGIGGSKRIVIWDNALTRLPDDQLLAVIGHEIGHYVLKHVYWGLALAVLGQVVILLLAQKYAHRAIAFLPKGWHIKGLSDPAIIPAIMLAGSIAMFFAEPVTHAISRFYEHQADEYGLTLTKNGPAMARCFVTLSEQNLTLPNPPAWIEAWLFTHPSLKSRIEFALKAN